MSEISQLWTVIYMMLCLIVLVMFFTMVMIDKLRAKLERLDELHALHLEVLHGLNGEPKP